MSDPIAHLTPHRLDILKRRAQSPRLLLDDLTVTERELIEEGLLEVHQTRVGVRWLCVTEKGAEFVGEVRRHG